MKNLIFIFCWIATFMVCDCGLNNSYELSDDSYIGVPPNISEYIDQNNYSSNYSDNSIIDVSYDLSEYYGPNYYSSNYAEYNDQNNYSSNYADNSSIDDPLFFSEYDDQFSEDYDFTNEEIIKMRGNLVIENVTDDGILTSTMVYGDPAVRDITETCKNLRNGSTCDKIYDDQVDSMCESLREGNATFKAKDALVYACGEVAIGKTVYLRMIKYWNSDEPNLLLSRGLAKLEKGSFIRSSETWSIRHGTDEEKILNSSDIEFLNSTAKVEVLDDISCFEWSRDEKWEQVLKDYGQNQTVLSYYAHILNIIRRTVDLSFFEVDEPDQESIQEYA